MHNSIILGNFAPMKSPKNQITIIGAVCAIACAALIAIVHLRQGSAVYAAAQPIETNQPACTPDIAAPADYEIPLCTAGQKEQRITHTGYRVSYNSDWHLPNWVAYQLTAEEVAGEEERSNKFLPDPQVKDDPVLTSDYTHSGYDRGHMAPAADMKWSPQAMRESFYMTNICPQNHSNNAGDWKDLEELGRDLAATYGNIYICCGPIVSDTSHTIGSARRIVVPNAFYKVLLRQKADNSWTAIGFVMPNAAGNRPLMTYMLPVDSVENIAGINFFHLLPDSIENTIESDYTVSDWIVSR